MVTYIETTSTRLANRHFSINICKISITLLTLLPPSSGSKSPTLLFHHKDFHPSPLINMLFQSISLFAFVASALAAPTTNTASTYVSAPAYKAPTYSTSPDSYAVVQTLHTDVYHWTAALSKYLPPVPTFPSCSITHPSNKPLDVTRDSYISSTNPKEKAIYVKQLKSEFSGLQQTLTTAQATLKKFGGKKTQHDQDLVVLVQDCVQEIRFTGEGLIPYLGHGEFFFLGRM